MTKLSKRMKAIKTSIDTKKIYTVEEAVSILKNTANVKFDSSLEAHISLGIDPKKGDQIVRSTVTLPHGNGKVRKLVAFTTKIDEAKAAGADIIGDEEYIEKIRQSGKCDFDIAVATLEIMPKLASIAKILGQKGLMPNPKSGTIDNDVKKMITELKSGKESFKNDDSANVHLALGKVSFDENKLVDNVKAFVDAVKKAKPQSLKGVYIKSIALSSTMGPGLKVSM
ncbi:MAG: 50S ribosomal protein L1 [Patescibacteria group bacterium]|nr:50S ribosomal protein L1 [Patescibacteria group bacterium]